MSKLAGSGGRTDGNSGYSRLFGHRALGEICSRIQSAVIRSGCDLEKILAELIAPEQLLPLETVLGHITSGEHLLLPEVTVDFKCRGICRSLGYEGHADIVVFEHRVRKALVVELKDGDNFDTKKSSAERKGLIEFAGWLATVSRDYEVAWVLCSFNQNDEKAICRGLKGRFGADEVITGPALCRLFGLDYGLVLELRRERQLGNTEALIEQLLSQPDLREMVQRRLALGFSPEQGSLSL